MSNEFIFNMVNQPIQTRLMSVNNSMRDLTINEDIKGRLELNENNNNESVKNFF
jgi:hypothetical protein